METRMKKLLLLLAGTAMLSLLSCTKTMAPADGPVQVKISVAGMSPDTKAIKTAWTDGDKINIWFGDATWSVLPQLVLTYSGGSFWLPLPESEDYTLPVQQVRDDGTEEVNLIHVTPDGFYMESSTCENQDCVDQGMVTLENRDSRILYNAVLCLPNMVSLALYTPEEILEMYASAPAPADDAETADENNQ